MSGVVNLSERNNLRPGGEAILSRDDSHAGKRTEEGVGPVSAANASARAEDVKQSVLELKLGRLLDKDRDGFRHFRALPTGRLGTSERRRNSLSMTALVSWHSPCCATTAGETAEVSSADIFQAIPRRLAGDGAGHHKPSPNLPTPAKGHMPVPGHRTVAEWDKPVSCNVRRAA